MIGKAELARWHHRVAATLFVVLAFGGGLAHAKDSVKMGLVAFISGPAAGVFGIPARNGAELVIDALNNGTMMAPFDTVGIAGAQIETVIVDEAGGATKQVAELRNLVQRQEVDFVLGYISSGDCLAVPQVADELKILTVLADCGTPRVFEEGSYKYVFRTGPHAVMDNVAAARYLLAMNPDAKRIAGINQNYAWGQDSWKDFATSMHQLQSGTEVVTEQFPKIFAGQYGAEISTLLAGRPDVIHSSLWGADLEAFILQAAGRGLFERSQVILSAGEQILSRIGRQLPDGTIIGARGPMARSSARAARTATSRPRARSTTGSAPNMPPATTMFRTMPRISLPKRFWASRPRTKKPPPPPADGRAPNRWSPHSKTLSGWAPAVRSK